MKTANAGQCQIPMFEWSGIILWQEFLSQNRIQLKTLAQFTQRNYSTKIVAVAMPISETDNVDAAQIKMGSMVENAITKALSTRYQTKIEEYDDSYAFGRKLRPRWIRVEGPYCENGSCHVLGPLPTANALQWEGMMVKKQVFGKEVYAYHHPFEQTIGFVKITKENDKSGVLAGPRHFVEGVEVSGFDYQQFFRRVSENLPDWVYFRIAKKGLSPYILNRDIEVEQ